MGMIETKIMAAIIIRAMIIIDTMEETMAVVVEAMEVVAETMEVVAETMAVEIITNTTRIMEKAIITTRKKIKINLHLLMAVEINLRFLLQTSKILNLLCVLSAKSTC